MQAVQPDGFERGQDAVQSLQKPIWYSIDKDLTTIDQRAVELDEALAIVRQYFADFQPSYSTGEEALAATMFGFSRAEDEFIEICVHQTDQASVRIGLPSQPLPWFLFFLLPWRQVFQHEETASSRETVEDRVRQFFTLSADECRARLKAGN